MESEGKKEKVPNFRERPIAQDESNNLARDDGESARCRSIDQPVSTLRRPSEPQRGDLGRYSFPEEARSKPESIIRDVPVANYRHISRLR